VAAGERTTLKEIETHKTLRIQDISEEKTVCEWGEVLSKDAVHRWRGDGRGGYIFPSLLFSSFSDLLNRR